MKAVSAAPRPDERTYLTGRNSLKVISYNILAPKYASYNSYCPPQFLAWDYRRVGLLREFDSLGADLMGLQECDRDFFYSELQGWILARGMRGEFLERPVGPVSGPAEGVALLWRDSALEVVANRRLLYAQMDPRVGGLPPEVAASRPWSMLESLGEGALMALMRHRPSGRLLLAAVTHLFWNPAFPDVKVLQAALLCGALSAFAREATATAAAGAAGGAADTSASASAAGETVTLVSGSPGSGPCLDPTQAAAPPPPPPPGVVLFGDFNSLAHKRQPDGYDPQLPPGGLASGVYTLLTCGSLPPDHPDHPATRLWKGEDPLGPLGNGGGGAGRFPSVALTSAGLQLASLNAEAYGREPALTTRTSSWAGCIDFVWLSRGDFAVASALGMPYDDDGLPPMVPGCGGSTAGGSTGGGGGSRDAPWRDPLTDISFTPIPDEFFPSDHLAVGGEVVVLAPAETPTAAAP